MSCFSIENLNTQPAASSKTHLVYLPIVIILFFAAYYPTLQWMYGRYMAVDSYYSHGFLVPFVTGFLIWQKREHLNPSCKIPSILGLFLIGAAAAVHILGTVLYIFSISGFSIFLFIVGYVLFFIGRENAGVIAFPIAFLLFMFPVPMVFISAISFPMKMLVARTGVDIVRILGIPAFREGFHISIPAGQLLVGNPCSGLRSLIAFMAMGAVLAHVSDLSISRKFFLFFLAIPIALLSNIIRVPMLILISHFWGLEAAAPDSFWHGGTGVLVFLVGLILLFGFGKVLK